MFTLDILCLTTFNLLWFMGLTFQIPMQYCSLQCQNLLLPPDTAKTGCHFHFGSASSFFLEPFLLSSPVAYWTPTNLGGSSSSVISFCLLILFTGFSRQEYWSGLPFLSPVDHALSELSIMTCLRWPCMAWLIVSLSYTKLWSMWSVWLVFCDCGFHCRGHGIVVLASSVCSLLDEDKEACGSFLMGGTLWGELGLALVGRACSVNL